MSEHSSNLSRYRHVDEKTRTYRFFFGQAVELYRTRMQSHRWIQNGEEFIGWERLAVPDREIFGLAAI